jgi:adenylate cyclase
MVVVHARHSPHPGVPSDVHCNAAAKQSAAIDLPEPGGPVINQAWVMVAAAVPVAASASAAL